MKRLLVIVVLGLLGASDLGAQVEEMYDPTRDNISGKYYAGPVLIYDCEDKHWACVSELDAELCQKKRAGEVSRGKIDLSCMAGEKFERKWRCQQQMRVLVARGNVPHACVHPDHRYRFIGFR